MHSLRDMALFMTKEQVRRQDLLIESDEAGLNRLHQRMSRAVASSLPPTLTLLSKLISRPLLVESHYAAVLTKMKESDFASLMTNLPPDKFDRTQAPKFVAAQFARALHQNLAKLVYEIWSDGRFACVPSHIMFPWTNLIG